MKAAAPGKVILSGEHAVVYGKPALAAAVDRFAYAEIEPLQRHAVELILRDYDVKLSLSIAEVDRRFAWLAQQRTGTGFAPPTSADLIVYLFGLFLDAYRLDPKGGLRLAVRSDIPIGSGMGSSAAVILSVLRVLYEFFAVPFDAARAYELALAAETLQHGRSSGVDPYLSLHGGFIRFQSGRAEPLIMPDLPFFAVDTGEPEATTGECVAAVAERFAGDAVWNDFAAATQALEAALLAEDAAGLRCAVRENHRLLCAVGVTPLRVQQFITEIEAEGGAAKISGAGSIRGNAAGIVIVFHNESPIRLAADYGYRLLSVKGEPHGARLV